MKRRLSDLTKEELRALYDRNRGLENRAYEAMVDNVNSYAAEIVGSEKAFRDYEYGSYCPGHHFDILDGPRSEFPDWYDRVSNDYGLGSDADTAIRDYLSAAKGLSSGGDDMDDDAYDAAEAAVEKLRRKAGSAIDRMIMEMYEFSDDDVFDLLTNDIECGAYSAYYLDDDGRLWLERADALIT